MYQKCGMIITVNTLNAYVHIRKTCITNHENIKINKKIIKC